MERMVTIMREKLSELKNDPNTKLKVGVIIGGVIAVVGIIVAVLVVRLGGMKSTKTSSEAADLITTRSVTTDVSVAAERNEAGGLIADIDWDRVIGYDADLNPVYGTNGLVEGVLGYDMFGAPLTAEEMVVTGTAEDGLPIYGNYSAIKQARIRGIQTNKNPDIDWNSIVAYDEDGNPIYGSLSGDPSIIGYDAAGNPIPVGSVSVTGRTEKGLPIYNYSAIATQKADGKNGQNGIAGKNGTNGTNGSSGKNGTNGKSGTSGKSGTNGTNGNNGRTGNTGNNGSNGTNGNDGLNGKKGNDGASVSIQGPKGDKGDKGTAGSKGEKGATGSQGEKGAAGDKGDKGEQGSQGAQGSQGIQGTQGVQGVAGATGAAGAAGQNGLDGIDGSDAVVYIMYANDASGSGMTATPSSSTKYIGIASAPEGEGRPSSPSAYAWSLYRDMTITATTVDGESTLIIQ